MKRFELKPMYSNQKSFYKKALVEESDDGDVTLISYDTKILTITHDDRIIAQWSGYTVTTQKHICEFAFQLFGVPCDKKTWAAIKEGRIKTVVELQKACKKELFCRFKA